MVANRAAAKKPQLSPPTLAYENPGVNCTISNRGMAIVHLLAVTVVVVRTLVCSIPVNSDRAQHGDSQKRARLIRETEAAFSEGAMTLRDLQLELKLSEKQVVALRRLWGFPQPSQQGPRLVFCRLPVAGCRVGQSSARSPKSSRCPAASSQALNADLEWSEMHSRSLSS